MSRRGVTGDGTIYKRKDGRWEAAVYLTTVGGARKRFRFYGKSRDSVRARLDAEKHRADRGHRMPESSWKVGDYLDHWLENVVAVSRSRKTYESYESAIRLYIKPNLGNTTLIRLSLSHVQAWINEALASGASPRVAHLIQKVLSAALTRAVKEELLDRNVARLVELPAYRRKEFTPWSIDQLQAFLSVARTDPLYSAFALISLYGLRRGEALGLRWCDIDRRNGLIHIRQQVLSLRTGPELGPLKTESSSRDLPLLPSADRLLSRHAALMASEVAGGRRKTSADDLVFSTRTGRPIEPRNLLRTLNRLAAQADLPHGTVHHLRHATATMLKNAGVPDRDAQLILGHADLSTTQQLYQHADREGQRRGLIELDRVLMSATDSRHGRQILPSNRVLPASSYSKSIWCTRTDSNRRPPVPKDSKPRSISSLTEVQTTADVRRQQHLVGGTAVIRCRQAEVAAGIGALLIPRSSHPNAA